MTPVVGSTLKVTTFPQKGNLMNAHWMTRWWMCLGVCFTLMYQPAFAAPPAKVRLFILSGQSNMVGLNPDISFTPALKKVFPKDEVIVVKHAEGGQPIRRWYKAWKAPAGVTLKAMNQQPGDLYDVLMARVKLALQGKTADTIVFVWMQGERDAREGFSGVYAEALNRLIKQLRDDLKRPDVFVVIGRIKESRKPG